MTTPAANNTCYNCYYASPFGVITLHNKSNGQSTVVSSVDRKLYY